MISDTDLGGLERHVQHALRTGDASHLNLLGHGEISLVLGWPPTEPQVACKRLPPFADRAQFDAYAAVVGRYVEALRAGGITVVDTEVRHIERRDGSVVGFHVQRAYPAAWLATEVLRTQPPDAAHPLAPAVVDAVVGVVTDRLGIDAQLSNWLWIDDRPVQLDLTTPFLLDDRGLPEFDLTPFLAALPAVVRPVVRRQMTSLVHRWTSPRGALLDMAANVVKEELDGWLDPILTHVNSRIDPPVTARDALQVNRSDRHLWPLLLRLERTNRWWQGKVRRRTYEFLLPERTTYERPH